VLRIVRQLGFHGHASGVDPDDMSIYRPV